MTADRVESGTRGAALVLEVFEGQYDRVVRYLATRIGDPSVAEDLASEVFVRAAEGIDGSERQSAVVQARVFRIAHNLVDDQLRYGKVGTAGPTEDTRRNGHGGEQEMKTLQRYDTDGVQRAMRSLTQEEQEIIALRVIAGLPATDVAVILGKDDATVRSLHHSALRSLQRAMDAQGRGVGS